MNNLLCVDLESWIFSKKINNKKLSLKELKHLDAGYCPNALNILLKLLKKYNQKITFFVVTKLEEIYPGTIEKILEDGHEVGWHTHTHEIIDTEEILKRELNLASKIIRKYKIKGFQAPAITFLRGGYEILKEHGFSYSSSIYGNANKIYTFDGVYEIPVSSIQKKYYSQEAITFPLNMTIKNMRKFGIPYGSSFFWGILGKNYYSRKMKEAEKSEKVVNTFIHEWQIITPSSREYKKDVSFLWNPLFLPYKINVANVFEFLLAHHKFKRCIDYIHEKTNERA